MSTKKLKFKSDLEVTGKLTVTADNGDTLEVATKKYVDSQNTTDSIIVLPVMAGEEWETPENLTNRLSNMSSTIDAVQTDISNINHQVDEIENTLISHLNWVQTDNENLVIPELNNKAADIKEVSKFAISNNLACVDNISKTPYMDNYPYNKLELLDSFILRESARSTPTKDITDSRIDPIICHRGGLDFIHIKNDSFDPNNCNPEENLLPGVIQVKGRQFYMGSYGNGDLQNCIDICGIQTTGPEALIGQYRPGLDTSGNTGAFDRAFSIITFLDYKYAYYDNNSIYRETFLNISSWYNSSFDLTSKYINGEGTSYHIAYHINNAVNTFIEKQKANGLFSSSYNTYPLSLADLADKTFRLRVRIQVQTDSTTDELAPYIGFDESDTEWWEHCYNKDKDSSYNNAKKTIPDDKKSGKFYLKPYLLKDPSTVVTKKFTPWINDSWLTDVSKRPQLSKIISYRADGTTELQAVNADELVADASENRIDRYLTPGGLKVEGKGKIRFRSTWPDGYQVPFESNVTYYVRYTQLD